MLPSVSLQELALVAKEYKGHISLNYKMVTTYLVLLLPELPFHAFVDL